MLRRSFYTFLGCFFVLLTACHTTKPSLQQLNYPSRVTGSGFFRNITGMDTRQRDSLAMLCLLGGNFPGFLRHLEPVTVEGAHPQTGKRNSITFWVTPDYLSIGTDNDWVRMPLSPKAAQVVADSLNCFLPTATMCDEIYRAAAVKLEPVPLYAFRDSTPVLMHHHLIIEGQRQGRKGLIAGIKKDVVLTEKLSERSNRVAIYGWHKPEGRPIQPLYTGHADWYVDYSHGIRLVSRQLLVNGQWMDYMKVWDDEALRYLLCGTEKATVTRYN
jgi:hypothetical protein